MKYRILYDKAAVKFIKNNRQHSSGASWKPFMLYPMRETGSS